MPGFLMKRSPSRARAGWFDSFDRAVENPAQKPWVHLGDGTPADINASQELHVPQNFGTANGGGDSYAYQPLTPNWGFEMELWFPVTGLASQGFTAYFTDSWTRIGAAFTNVVGVRLMHAPIIGPDFVQLSEFANVWTAAGPRGQWNSPVTYNGTTITFAMWVDNDQFVRIWINGTYVGGAMISNAFKLGPDRRCMRFLNAALCDVWIRWVYHYDRPSDFPTAVSWSSSFYDDFNRTNAPVGNGWTTYGSTNEAQIRANSYAWANTNDGTRAVMRSTGTSNGRQRVEAVIGGNANLSASPSVLLARCNAAGTNGLACFVSNGTITLNRLTGSIAVTSPANVEYGSVAPTFTNSDKIALCAYDNWAWVEVNGVPVIYAFNINATIPVTQNYCGLAVRRNAFTNSNSWNDTRLLVA